MTKYSCSLFLGFGTKKVPLKNSLNFELLKQLSKTVPIPLVSAYSRFTLMNADSAVDYVAFGEDKDFWNILSKHNWTWDMKIIAYIVFTNCGWVQNQSFDVYSKNFFIESKNYKDYLKRLHHFSSVFAAAVTCYEFAQEGEDDDWEKIWSLSHKENLKDNKLKEILSASIPKDLWVTKISAFYS